ncbi:hypothetical protein L9F63_012590, partial [Diploptera punctata]
PWIMSSDSRYYTLVSGMRIIFSFNCSNLVATNCFLSYPLHPLIIPHNASRCYACSERCIPIVQFRLLYPLLNGLLYCE